MFIEIYTNIQIILWFQRNKWSNGRKSPWHMKWAGFWETHWWNIMTPPVWWKRNDEPWGQRILVLVYRPTACTTHQYHKFSFKRIISNNWLALLPTSIASQFLDTKLSIQFVHAICPPWICFRVVSRWDVITFYCRCQRSQTSSQFFLLRCLRRDGNSILLVLPGSTLNLKHK